MTSEERGRPFDDKKARGYLAAWMSTMEHPELRWAWMAACGIIELYAELCTTRKKSLADSRREQWRDWFDCWGEGDGEAHYGIIGAMQEVENAVPLEHWDSFCVTLDHAREIGDTGLMPTSESTLRLRKRSAVATPEPAKPAAVGLRLVVNNTPTTPTHQGTHR